MTTMLRQQALDGECRRPVRWWLAGRSSAASRPCSSPESASRRGRSCSSRAAERRRSPPRNPPAPDQRKVKYTGVAVCSVTRPHRDGNSRAIWDHTVLPATRQRWHSRPYPSRSWYSIKRSQRDARLSWPSWLVTYWDDIPARRRSPIQVLTGPDVRSCNKLQ